MTAYHRPATLQEALEVRAKGDVVPIAGGTDVYPAKVARAGWGDMRHADVLDITRLTALRGIEKTATHWRFGALTTWTEIMEAPLPEAFAGLKQAARNVGGVQIQNRGTLAGNIATASPAGDGAPNLLALDAEIELASLNGTRRVPMAAFITGYRKTACKPDELITAILVPHMPEDAQGGFLKLGARRYLVISIAMAAGVVACDANGNVNHIRLSVGACSATPLRLEGLERALAGKSLADAAAVMSEAHLADLAPIDDIRGSAAYRREAAKSLVCDLLTGLAADGTRRAA